MGRKCVIQMFMKHCCKHITKTQCSHWGSIINIFSLNIFFSQRNRINDFVTPRANLAFRFLFYMKMKLTVVAILNTLHSWHWVWGDNVRFTVQWLDDCDKLMATVIWFTQIPGDTKQLKPVTMSNTRVCSLSLFANHDTVEHLIDNTKSDISIYCWIR